MEPVPPSGFVNQMVLGDCIDILRRLPADCADMVLTDPPYGISFLSNMTSNHRRIANDGFSEWKRLLPVWLHEIRRVLKPNGVVVMFGGGGGGNPVIAHQTLQFSEYFDLIQTVIWDKKRPGLGWRYRSRYESVLVGSKGKKYAFYDESRKLTNIIQQVNLIPKKGDHPTPKPVELLQTFIQIHTHPGDLVIDPFMGGGSTIEACVMTARNYFGVEIDAQYYAMSLKRIADLQGRMNLN
jgi:DNA modification methylase